ncbi:sulfatase [Fulvivirgaceae bacterium BMA10]|uniref:Sulfatase n=1 Tax=Splendidivirga corallicola TaxID=3051826 RepID=A0ABT8KW55_9BACT|nr:sulfatase [Fulvivirgaceae bacterium BMA10]
MKHVCVFSKYLFVLLSLLYLVACGAPDKQKEKEQEASKEPPNIVIIFTDDQGYQDVGCYGSPDIQTPNLDQMASEGIRFTNFYVSQPVCSASRASLLTGCYPNRLGIHGALWPGAEMGLNPDETTIAEMLKPLGYATAIYGKWHLGDVPELLPERQGFDDYYGLPYSNDMWPHHPEGMKFPDLPLIDGEEIIAYNPDQTKLTTTYTEKAVEFIEQNKDRPFFLYLPHSMPHVPLFVSDKFKGKSPRGLYGDVIMEIDWSVGEILKTLEQYDLEENTLVIFTSDNGPWLSYGEHSGSALPLREGKGTTWEGGVRVPCIMKWPSNIPAGKVSNISAMTIDLLPTIAEFTGAQLPEKKIDGKSIAPIVLGKANAKNPHEAYYFYYRRNELQAVLSDHWKLYLPHTYRSLNGREGGKEGFPVKYDMNEMDVELYNVRDDISETKNVASEHQDIVEKLLALADKSREELGDALTNKEGKGVRPVGKVQVEKE